MILHIILILKLMRGGLSHLIKKKQGGGEKSLSHLLSKINKEINRGWKSLSHLPKIKYIGGGSLSNLLAKKEGGESQFCYRFVVRPPC